MVALAILVVDGFCVLVTVVGWVVVTIGVRFRGGLWWWSRRGVARYGWVWWRSQRGEVWLAYVGSRGVARYWCVGAAHEAVGVCVRPIWFVTRFGRAGLWCQALCRLTGWALVTSFASTAVAVCVSGVVAY